MKNLTRVLALVLTFAMMISTVAMAASFTDIAAGSTYAEATAVLADLGILYGYEDGTFGADKVITRAEVAAVVNRLQGLSDAAKAAGGATQYTDVPSTEWYAGDVNLATQMGIVNGDGNGLFRPNDQVKYEEAVKMIVAALGYDQQYVLNKGGWPTGYLVIATEAGVSKGLSAGAGEPAYRGTVAKLAYNALTAKTFAFQNYATGDGSAYYGVSEEKIILEQKLQTYKYTGYVSANEKTSLASKTGTEEGKIEFVVNKSVKAGEGAKEWTDGVLLVGNTDVAATLGNTVDVYIVENEDGDFEVVSYVVNAKNKTVAIEEPKYIQGTEGDYASVLDGRVVEDEEIDNLEDDVLSYYNSDTEEEEEYDLDETAKLIVNGQYYGSMAAAAEKNMYAFSNGEEAEGLGLIYAPAYGAVELLDNDNDGDYDFVFVTSYEVAVVSNVISTSSVAKIYTNGSGTIDLTNQIVKETEGYSYSLTLDGAEAEITELKENDVIAVAMTADKKTYEIKATRKTVSGTVSEVDSEENEYYVDGVAYKVANLVNKDKAELIGVVQVTDVVTFYLDAFGNVALADRTSTSAKNYGFIVTASEDEIAGDPVYEVRLLDKNGEMAVYNLAEYVRFADVAADGVTARTAAEDVYDAIKDLKGEDWINKTAKEDVDADDVDAYAKRVITYKLNSAGEISEIVFAADSTAKDTKSSFTYNKENAHKGLVYYAKKGLIGAYDVSEDTVVFNLLIDEEASRDDFSVSTIASLANEGAYNVAFLSIDEDGVAGAIVVVNNPVNVASGSNLAIVTKFAETANEEGDSILRVTFYQNGELQSLKTTKDIALDAFEIGDVFEYAVDAEGNINKIAMGGEEAAAIAYDELAGKVSDKENTANYDAKTTDDQYVFGKVEKKKASRLTIANEAAAVAHVVDSAANVYVIDVTGANIKVNVSDLSEIQAAEELPEGEDYDADYDYTVFMKYSNGEVIDVIAIKGMNK